MEIETTYAVGDEIYLIESQRVLESNNCPACGGTGDVRGIDNLIYDCSNCEGNGIVGLKKRVWNVREAPFKIAHLYVEVGEKTQLEEYCEDPSGGSQYYGHERLFPTREEAQAECNRLNECGKSESI